MEPQLSDIHAIVLAGGLGTRLRSVISDRPKVLAPLGTGTVLDRILDNLLRAGFHHITLSTGYMKDKIREHMEQRALPGHAHIGFSEEERPLGTGGAIQKALAHSPSETALVLNGDTLFHVDYASFVRQHQDHGADVSLCLRPMEHAGRYGTVHTDIDNRIIAFREKDGRAGPGMINGGVYLFNKNILSAFGFPEAFSIEKDFFEKHATSVTMCGFTFPDDFIDVGLPEDYARVRHIYDSAV